MKKNKITILLVACVLMLTVYYIQMPSNNIDKPSDGGGDVVSQESYFAPKRAEIVSGRTELFDQLNLIIGNDTSTMKEKEMALETMNEITTLQEKEISLEKMIKNLGYKDCLVYANDQVIKINVLADEFTVEAYVEIAVMAKSHFDRTFVVNIETNKLES